MEFEAILPSENFQGILDALSHFGELVSLEARNEQFLLSAFNGNRTAQAVIHIAREFFKDYKLLRRGSNQTSIPCTVSNRNINSILKKNMSGIRNIKECHLRIAQAPEDRIYTKLIYRNGVTKKNTIWYNDGDPIVHLFQQNHPYRLECEPGVFKVYMNKFDPRIQELAIVLDPQKITLMSSFDDSSCLFADRPVKSSFMIPKADFKSYELEPMTLVVNLKDFKTMIDYVDMMESMLTLEFTAPGRPILFRYRYQSTMIVLVAIMTKPEHLHPISEEEQSYASTAVKRHRPPIISSPTTSSSQDSSRVVEPVSQPSPQRRDHDTIPQPLSDSQASSTLSQQQQYRRLTTIERIRLQKNKQKESSPMSLPSLDKSS
ncbi:Rad9-domain-containing protein [Blakeslea trispora]|nr:Rad9-domain-containing protein [Blakeslea trispora]